MSDPKPSSKTATKKIELLLADLRTEIPTKVTAALDSLQVYGEWTVIKPLFLIIQERKKTVLATEVLEFLSGLKDSKSKTAVMNCLLDPALENCKIEILTSIWNSLLDYSEYLHEFVRIAVCYEFMESLECLTVIENLAGPFSEQSILESQLFLKDYHEEKFAKNEQKDQLISEIALLLKDFDRNLQDFDDEIG